MDKGCCGPQASCQQQQQQKQATSVVQKQPSSHQKQPAEKTTIEQPAEQLGTEQPPSIAQLQLQVSNPLLKHVVEQPTTEATD